MNAFCFVSDRGRIFGVIYVVRRFIRDRDSNNDFFSKVAAWILFFNFYLVDSAGYFRYVFLAWFGYGVACCFR